MNGIFFILNRILPLINFYYTFINKNDKHSKITKKSSKTYLTQFL